MRKQSTGTTICFPSSRPGVKIPLLTRSFPPRSTWSFTPAPSSRLLPELAAEHLARQRFGKVRDELHLLRGLVGRDHTPGVLLDLLRQRRRGVEARLQRHVGPNLLADQRL